MKRLDWCCENCGTKENLEINVMSRRCRKCYSRMVSKEMNDRIAAEKKKAGMLK